MGLFNNKDRNSVQLNELTDIHYRNCYLGWGWYEKHKKKFHSLVLWSILDQIFRGLMNVSFINQKKPAFEVDAVISFLESNYVILLDQYWALGFMAVQGDRNMNFRVIPEQDIKKDTKGRVINKNSIVVYSPHYQTDRITDLQIIKPYLDLLDSLGTSLSEGTENMGTLPIISGESIPANAEFKQDLSELMSRDYGSTKKYPYFLSKAPLDVKTIDLNIKDLEIDENMLETFKYLCRFFGVPTDLIVGGSTFTNSQEAIKHFYDTTIRFYAEMLLQLGRAILTSCTTLPKASMNYKIMNVAGLDQSLKDTLSEKNAYIDTLLKLRDAGFDVTEELAKVVNDVKIAYKEA